jgi:D-aminoacyl-tRNA deacylase
MFVEIGSSEKQWEDPVAAKAVADAVWAAATRPSDGSLAVGFGGGHYSWKHTDAVVRSDLAVGHILSKYFFEQYDPAIVDLAFRRSVGQCSKAIIDKKGMRGPQRAALTEFLTRTGRIVQMV